MNSARVKLLHVHAVPEKEFFIYLESATIFVSLSRHQGDLTDFRVVLLTEIEDQTYCVCRYDTAHDFVHKDILGMRRGILAKKAFLDSTTKEIFFHAIQDFKANFKDYIRFFQEN